MPVAERTYERLALTEPERQWELHDGRPREKPGMGAEHNWLMFYLGYLLQSQLNIDAFHVRVNAGRLRRSTETAYIPDVAVIPVALERTQRDRPGTLESYDEPLPLVVEVWSPSTGSYDVDAKFPEYERRGDLEIWRLHPFEHTLIARRRQPNGTYVETIHDSGTVEPASLPGVRIDLDALFA